MTFLGISATDSASVGLTNGAPISLSAEDTIWPQNGETLDKRGRFGNAQDLLRSQTFQGSSSSAPYPLSRTQSLDLSLSLRQPDVDARLNGAPSLNRASASGAGSSSRAAQVVSANVPLTWSLRGMELNGKSVKVGLTKRRLDALHSNSHQALEEQLTDVNLALQDHFLNLSAAVAARKRTQADVWKHKYNADYAAWEGLNARLLGKSAEESERIAEGVFARLSEGAAASLDESFIAANIRPAAPGTLHTQWLLPGPPPS